MATRPEEFTTWASDETQVTEPAGGLKTTGWSPGDRPPAQYMNWLAWLSDQWDQWLAQETDRLSVETVRRQMADAIAVRAFDSGSIVSGSHNWNCATVGNTADNGLVTLKYWVGGDDGAGTMAAAWSASGTSWVDDSGTAPSGSVAKIATNADASRALCIGQPGTQDWFLTGTTNLAGTVPSGTVLDVAYDALNDEWVVLTTIGVYTSPVGASITWTLSENGGVGVVHYDGVTYLVDHSGGARLRTRTSGAWTTVSTTAVTGNTFGVWVSDEGIVIMTDTPHLYLSTDGGVTFTQVTPASSDVTTQLAAIPTMWNGVFCTEGVYMSHGLAADQWRGVGYTTGVGARLWGSNLGPACMTNGADTIRIFPAVHLPGVSYAV